MSWGLPTTCSTVATTAGYGTLSGCCTSGKCGAKTPTAGNRHASASRRSSTKQVATERRDINAALSTVTAFRDGPEYQNQSSEMAVDVLLQLRVITLIITLEVFFGIDPGVLCNYELIVIVHEMVAYLKAWEYILRRPASTRDGEYHHHSMRQHLHGIHRLVERTQELLAIAPSYDANPSLFVNRLQRLPGCVPEHVAQCALEMLLAGIDTAAVRMHHLWYKISEPGLEESAIRLCHEADLVLRHQDLARSDRSARLSPSLEDCLRVPVRVKPIGPVVMRRAACDETVLLEDRRTVQVGAGDTIVLNLPRLHRDRGEHLSIVEMKVVVACLLSRLGRSVVAPYADAVATTLSGDHHVFDSEECILQQGFTATNEGGRVDSPTSQRADAIRDGEEFAQQQRQWC